MQSDLRVRCDWADVGIKCEAAVSRGFLDGGDVAVVWRVSGGGERRCVAHQGRRW